jgi:hypothetical protein
MRVKSPQSRSTACRYSFFFKRKSDEEVIEEQVEGEESGYVNMKMTEGLIKTQDRLHESAEFVKYVLQ